MIDNIEETLFSHSVASLNDKFSLPLQSSHFRKINDRQVSIVHLIDTVSSVRRSHNHFHLHFSWVSGAGT